MMKTITLFILFGLVLFSNAQVKFEKESRIQSHEVPNKALELLEELEVNTKVKWYLEQSQEGTSYEAKFKVHGRRNSLEFNENGVFMDLEIEMDWKSLPNTVRSTIEHHLSKSTEKHKVCKVQEQIVAEEDVLEDLMENQSYIDNTMVVRYELIVEIKRNGEFLEIEALFDHKGMFIQESTVIPPNTDNLEF